ncbi:tetratricopeptide repeat protein [Oryzifoliimicrobium ureilyticus]|uniref:tetratricopeptide repeat protein n=1 Tax=Oryzifoliimicrobium ureilyticus TaxID=3113724 RepID=UPI0030765A83
MLVLLADSFDRSATAQNTIERALNGQTCKQPSGGLSSIAACDRLVSSGRYTGHALAVILNGRGLLRFKDGETEGALADYNVTIVADEGLGAPYYNRGLAFVQFHRLREATDSFGEAGRRVPDKAAIWYNRGVARVMTGDFKDALPDFDRAIALDPR